MLQIVDIATVNSFRKFTMTSGYNNSNTKFVRVSDGYSVGADPIPVRKGDRITKHHIKYEGYLYGLRKGYVLATQKDGYRGWTDVVKIATDTYKVFNPFEGRTIELVVDGSTLTINDGKDKSSVAIGTYATIFGEVEVHATPFKGLRNFMQLLRQLPEWATEHVNNVSYNSDFTKKYDMGVVTVGTFDPLENFDLRTVEYCVVDKSNTMVKVDGRYFAMQNNDYHRQVDEFLTERGILTLAPASGHYEGTARIPANSGYETTELQWNFYTTDKEIVTGRVLLGFKPEDVRPLHEVEVALLNLPAGNCNNYTAMQYVFQSLGLGEASNGGMRDEFRGLTDYGRTSMHENVKAVYFQLLRMARKTSAKSAQMLCNLVHMSYHTDCLKWDYQFESDRLLGTFLSACMRNGKDMSKLWMDAIALQPQSMTDWINSNLVYWVEDHHVGYNFRNNAAWCEKRNYQGNIVYIFAENASCAKYNPIEVSEEEYGIYIVRLAEERAYKARYDAVPNTVADKHLYIKQQDNPEQFVKATGKGKLSGCKNMGSCQCGDVDWWINYDCDTLEFSYGNSNWSNRGDFHIPYVGNALEMVVKATNITEGWKCV